MSIYVDGERSRQRLGFAKSMLNKLKMMGLKTKTLLYEGFLYRVKTIAPGLDKVAVTAPMGAAVVCSSETGMQLFTADYWLSGFTPARDVYVVDNAVSAGVVYTTISANAVLPNAKFIPRATTSPTDFPTYTEYPDHVPVPGLYSFPSEAFWLTVSASPASSALRLVESSLTFYTQSGKGSKRISMFSEGQISGVGLPVTQALPAESVSLVTHSVGEYTFKSVTNELTAARAFSGDATSMQISEFPGWIMFNGVPTGLQTLLLSYPNNYTRALGSFAFAVSASDQPTLLHCASATASAFDGYFASNPTHAPWRIFFSIYTLGAGYITTYPVNTALLESLVPGTAPSGVVDWDKARDVMWQLFPWPNDNFTVPPDSAMFYSEAGDVYTWTRKYGAVKFGSAGMSAASIVLPTQVTSTPGVRPEIYHTGGGVYFCSAFKPGHMTDPVLPGDEIGVVGLYLGSPFGSWETLPMPTGVRLLQARLISIDAAEMLIAGVVLEGTQYRFAMLRLVFSGGSWSGGWRSLSPLNMTNAYPDKLAWGLGVFGDVPVNEYLCPPPTLPQLPAIPYSAYAATMP